MKLFRRVVDVRGWLRDAGRELGELGHDLARSRTLWIGAALIATYWVIARYAPTGPQNDAIRVGRLSVAVAVAIGFGISIIRVLRTPWPGHSGTIVLGITVSWASTAGSAAWVLIWALAGRPNWMIQSNMNGFWIFLNMLGGMLHLVAYNVIDGVVPRRAWIKIGATVGAVLAISIWLALSAPDATVIAQWLKPIFADFPEIPD